MNYLLKEMTLDSQEIIFADIQKSNDNYMKSKLKYALKDYTCSFVHQFEDGRLLGDWAVNEANNSYLFRDFKKSVVFLKESVFCFYYKNTYHQLIASMANFYWGPYMLVNTTEEIVYDDITKIPEDFKKAITAAFRVYKKYGISELARLSPEQIAQRKTYPVKQIEFINYSIEEYGKFYFE